MITLTNPIQVTTVLGSTSKTNYDKLDLTMLTYDVIGQQIVGSCRLSSSSASAATNIEGSFSIPASGGPLTISIPNLPFFAALSLNSDQQAVVRDWITTAQNNVEGGLVGVGVVQGAQSTGL